MSHDYSIDCRIIRFGDMGFDVKMIQRLLFCSGIKDKNTGHGCRITGILDNQTIRKMLCKNKRVFRTSELVCLIRDTAYVSCIAGQNPDNIGVVLCRF